MVQGRPNAQLVKLMQLFKVATHVCVTQALMDNHKAALLVMRPARSVPLPTMRQNARNAMRMHMVELQQRQAPVLVAELTLQIQMQAIAYSLDATKLARHAPAKITLTLDAFFVEIMLQRIRLTISANASQHTTK
jgi:hypothetical protein